MGGSPDQFVLTPANQLAVTEQSPSTLILSSVEILRKLTQKNQEKQFQKDAFIATR
jgi:hypothetical protein